MVQFQQAEFRGQRSTGQCSKQLQTLGARCSSLKCVRAEVDSMEVVPPPHRDQDDEEPKGGTFI